MRCQKCQKELEHEEYRKVADWFFCMDCFQKLLDKPSVSAEAPKVGTGSAPPLSSENQQPLTCQVCEQIIGGKPFKKIGLWAFCQDCYTSLNQSLVAAQPECEPVQEEPEPAEEDMKSRILIDFMVQNKLPCQQCGRIVPERGMKQAYGKNLCPDCWYALTEKDRAAAQLKSEIESLESEPTPKRAAEPEIGPGNRVRCDSCQRETPESGQHLVEGFFLCQACRGSDIDTALEIARKRHRRYLQSLKEGM